MNHRHARVAIIGGGLSGLYAAHLLEQEGIRDWVLLEGRQSLGGRILSLPAAEPANSLDRFDLGPAWFWPDYQPQLGLVIDRLGLTRFSQFDAGGTMVERNSQEPPQRVNDFASSPHSMRLAGGIGVLIDKLSSGLDPMRIHLQHKVRALRCTGRRVELDVEQLPKGDMGTWHVDHVLVAMPPRLFIQTFDCDPPLPPPLQGQWARTPTWMAPHAKFIAVYDRPFWRDEGLSGHARSACGPMVEIHDASVPGGSAALFGFVGVPARLRRTLSADALRATCLAQLVRLFGDPAAAPKAQLFKDWACDPFTATLDDLSSGGQHALAPDAFPDRGLWQGRITGVGSEWSPQYPGYLAGCLEAASLGVRALVRQFALQAAPP